MKKRKDLEPRTRRNPGSVAHSDGRTLKSYNVGALPILNRFLVRAGIEEYLKRFVTEDKRCKLSPVTSVLILLRNYLVSRQPIYAVGDWAIQHDPSLLGLAGVKTSALNDDGVGRCLDRLFRADCVGLLLAITGHAIKAFDLELSELHNDSTTVTFSGKYEGAREPIPFLGQIVPAITWGHNKDHRPDLKQLLYNLTVTADGGVPVAFGVENGNVTDDKTHQANWELLCKIVASPDFLYVADSKLATHANMTYIAGRGGRFLSVLPATRKEDRVVRERLAKGGVQWDPVLEKLDEQEEIVDVVRAAREVGLTAEGFRLLWYHSSRKVELDRATRADVIERGLKALGALAAKLRSPRTRYRDQAQVERAVSRALADSRATPWLRVQVVHDERQEFVQETPGRPGKNTRYRKEIRSRYDLVFDVDHQAVEEAERFDGIFPLVTNDHTLSVKEVYETYKRQSQIEKRFAQLKTQFQVAPVYLKSPRRVVALLTVYYLALLTQGLIERELRQAMRAAGIGALALYHEERECRAPTTRRIIDCFDNVQRHELHSPGSEEPLWFTTEISALQRQILELLRIPTTSYGV